VNIPKLHISQTYAQLSIRQDPGGVEIEQPKAKVEIKTQLPSMEIERVESKLEIDQSKAWDAYGIINPLEMNSRIYGQVRDSVVPQAIAKIAQDGDRMAAIHRSTGVIAELAAESWVELQVNFAGEASYNNVDVNYTPDQLSFRLVEGVVNIQVEPQWPIIQHKPSQVNIAVEKYPSIQIEWRGRNVDRML
jgi:hypothetical protein